MSYPEFESQWENPVLLMVAALIFFVYPNNLNQSPPSSIILFDHKLRATTHHAYANRIIIASS
jgi:hypothetical protein